MIVETSALVAILQGEEEAAAFVARIADAPVRRISAANYVEAAILFDRARNANLGPMLDAFLQEAGLIVEPVTGAQANLARVAYRMYGKGSGHPAQLNFGDCFSYALAKATGEPLLYKGNDFVHTDIASAIS